MNIVLLIKVFYIYLTFTTIFFITFELLIPFDIFSLQYYLKMSWKVFETSNKFNKILLKELNSHIYKIEELNWTKRNFQSSSYTKKKSLWTIITCNNYQKTNLP